MEKWTQPLICERVVDFASEPGDNVPRSFAFNTEFFLAIFP